jgi:hypothetical protein
MRFASYLGKLRTAQRQPARASPDVSQTRAREFSNVAFVRPEETAVSGDCMDASINVGEVYAYLLRDLHAGAYNAPDFEHALHNARLIEAVRRADELGERQKVLEQIEGFDEATVPIRS